MADSGQPKLWLDAADPLELISRCGISLEQAQYLATKAQDEEFKLTDLILENRPMELNNSSFFQQNDSENAPTAAFTPDEVDAVMSEVTLSPNHRPKWGKININTVPAKLLYEIFQDDEQMVQDILAMRAARSEGISSLMSLWELPSMDEAQMGQMLTLFTTQSNVFTIVSRGKSKSSGQEVEIIAVVDRSTIPIKIIEYRED